LKIENRFGRFSFNKKSRISNQQKCVWEEGTRFQEEEKKLHFVNNFLGPKNIDFLIDIYRSASFYESLLTVFI
jgi:hypothetical protein